MLSVESAVWIRKTLSQQNARVLALSVLIPHMLVFLALLPLTSEWGQELFRMAKATWVPSHLLALVAVMLGADSPSRVCWRGFGAWFISGPAVIPSLAFCYTQVFSGSSEPSGLHFVALSVTEFFASTFFAFAVVQALFVFRRRAKHRRN